MQLHQPSLLVHAGGGCLWGSGGWWGCKLMRTLAGSFSRDVSVNQPGRPRCKDVSSRLIHIRWLPPPLRGVRIRRHRPISVLMKDTTTALRSADALTMRLREWCWRGRGTGWVSEGLEPSKPSAPLTHVSYDTGTASVKHANTRTREQTVQHSRLCLIMESVLLFPVSPSALS